MISTINKDKLRQEVAAAIRHIPNFPEQDVSFKDISGVFQDPKLSEEVVTYLAEQAMGKVDAVCGVESRGFLFGFPIALKLGVPFILIRKKGKLPPPTKSIAYHLEYGQAELEVVADQIEEGMRILVHDDVLATGGTAKATAQLVASCGATVPQFSFLIALDYLNGREQLAPTEVVSIVNYE